MCGLALLGSTTNADAATRTWKAFTVDNLWSNTANWEEGVAPVDGDDLRFPVPGGGGPATVVNDIANLRVHTLVTNGDYTITGQPFTLLNSLFGSGTAIYDVHITMVGDQIWTLHSYNVTLNGGLTLGGDFTVASGLFVAGTLRIPGVLSGNGSVRMDGTGCARTAQRQHLHGPDVRRPHTELVIRTPSASATERLRTARSSAAAGSSSLRRWSLTTNGSRSTAAPDSRRRRTSR